MAIDMMKWGILGAIVGAGTGYLLSGLNKVFALIPGVDIVLQSAVEQPAIVLKTTGISALVNPGASDLVNKMFGVIPANFTIPEIAILAISGAAMFVGAAYLLDMAGMLPSKKYQKVAAVLGIGALGTGLILSGSVPAIATIVGVGISALILGMIVTLIDDNLKLGLVP